MGIPSLVEVAGAILPIHMTDSENAAAPLLVNLRNAGRNLWVAGTRHTRDPHDPQLPFLESYFRAFVHAAGSSGLLCIEGTIPPAVDSGAGAVVSSGESGLLVHIARGAGIAAISVEPDFADVIAWARELFPQPLAHAGWAVLNMLMPFVADGSFTAGASTRLRAALPHLGTTFGVEGDADRVYDTVRNFLISEDIVDLPACINDVDGSDAARDVIIAAQRPHSGPHATNRAAESMNLARDYGLLAGALKACIRGGDSQTFAWFGLNHVLSLLPALVKVGYKKALSQA